MVGRHSFSKTKRQNPKHGHYADVLSLLVSDSDNTPATAAFWPTSGEFEWRSR